MARSSGGGSSLLLLGAVGVGGYLLWQYLSAPAPAAAPSSNVVTGTPGASVGDTSGSGSGSGSSAPAPAAAPVHSAPALPVRVDVGSAVVLGPNGVASKRAPAGIRGTTGTPANTVNGSNVTLSGFGW